MSSMEEILENTECDTATFMRMALTRNIFSDKSERGENLLRIIERLEKEGFFQEAATFDKKRNNSFCMALGDQIIEYFIRDCEMDKSGETKYEILRIMQRLKSRETEGRNQGTVLLWKTKCAEEIAVEKLLMATGKVFGKDYDGTSIKDENWDQVHIEFPDDIAYMSGMATDFIEEPDKAAVLTSDFIEHLCHLIETSEQFNEKVAFACGKSACQKLLEAKSKNITPERKEEIKSSLKKRLHADKNLSEEMKHRIVELVEIDIYGVDIYKDSSGNRFPMSEIDRCTSTQTMGEFASFAYELNDSMRGHTEDKGIEVAI